MTTDTFDLDDIAVPAPPPGPADWNDDGVVVMTDAVDVDLIARYQRAWLRSNGGLYSGPIAEDPLVLLAERKGGWPDCCPYMRHPEILDLVAPLAEPLADLIGEPAGVNLNLTGWVSTQRNWHADAYLNPRTGPGDRYAAVWVALGDIHPDSGPFQYVPGSHRWPQITQDVIGRFFDLRDPTWPKQSEQLLTDLFEREIERRGAEIVTHLPKRGTVLVWHGRLLHRGSVAKVPGAYRPAFIAHFSGIHSRPDFPPAVEHERGGWLFPIVDGGQV